MAYFGEPGLALDTTARFVLSRIESSKGGGLPTIGEARGIGVERQDNSAGALTNAGNAVEQFALLLQIGMVVDMIIDGVNQLLNGRIQPILLKKSVFFRKGEGGELNDWSRFIGYQLA